MEIDVYEFVKRPYRGLLQRTDPRVMDVAREFPGIGLYWSESDGLYAAAHDAETMRALARAIREAVQYSTAHDRTFGLPGYGPWDQKPITRRGGEDW